MKRSFLSLLMMLAVLALTRGSSAQVATTQVSSGTPPFSSLGGGPFDTVNLGNLNVHFSIPVFHKAGRGMSFDYDLNYESSIWIPVTSGTTTTWKPVNNWGWRGKTEAGTGYISFSEVDTFPIANCQISTYSGYVYHDTVGSPHPFPGKASWQFGIGGHSCTTIIKGFTATASDGSGYSINITTNTGTGTLTSPGGSLIAAPFNAPNGGTSTSTVTDANGNQISANTSGQFFDTLSSTTPVLTISGSGTPASPTQLTYTSPSGTSAAYTMNYTQYTVATNFGVSNGSGLITEYARTSTPLVTSITLPDDTSTSHDRYTFTYETTPGSCTPLSGTSACVTGRIISVTLPTGGSITYQYTGGPTSTGIYSDGSTSGLNRIISPSSSCTSGGCWKYVRALASGTPGPGSTWTTTITDPTNNQTVLNFAEDSTVTNTSTLPYTTATYSFYETQRQEYQGSMAPANLLSTVMHCYNGNYTSCPTSSVSSPIYSSTIYSQLPNGSTRASVLTYNGSFLGSGLLSDDHEYGFGVTLGSSPSSTYLVRETTIGYASLTNGIVDRPSSITVSDWTSGTAVTVASSTFTYDQTTPTATSGTPQHIPITGSRGNLTTIATKANTTTTLSKTFTYFDTGNVNQATDINGAPTTYTYGNCGNSFPTLITAPLGLSTSATWDCVGGVQKTSIDLNSNTTTTVYTPDAYFWRPHTTTDPGSNVWNYSYTSPGTRSETAMVFGSATVDQTINFDAFGRPSVVQQRQAPGVNNFDTVETDYDTVGNVSKTTLPYLSTSYGQTNPTGPNVATTYDAEGRPLTVTDSGGGTINYSYINNDVLQTIGPAPTGENTKRKQLEYDGLGRLVSVCEITSGTISYPGGSCTQSNPQTGYWTKYTYDTSGGYSRTTVQQNAQSGSPQTRIYLYDLLGRLVSETNPENGTITYIYDSDTTGNCTWPSTSYYGSIFTGTYNGDLVRKTDAVGNQTCYQYDALHRVTGEITPYGTYYCARGAGSPCYSPNRYFIYDSATVNSVTMTNAKGRLAEAYTCVGACSSKTTDLGMSYSVLGKLADTYEDTSHQNVYFHASSTYWPNGTLNTLNLYGSGGTALMPTQTYGVDGEGRSYSVSASSGQNPVTSTSYNVTGQPVAMTFGSGDTDSFTPDPNTGRMNIYQYNVGSSSVKGTLNWNSNGSLGQLAIVDGLNSVDTHTCNYNHDDLSRISIANCGSTWSQTFSFDPFGNIEKAATVGTQYLPTYDPSTNRVLSVPGCTSSYDANGNPTYDCALGSGDSYTWDADGNMTGVGGLAVVHDALGRSIEVYDTSVNDYEPIVYNPAGGGKLAGLYFTSLYRGYVPLPDGSTAVYEPSGLAFYRRADWLSSGRLATTPGSAVYFDTAYGPYGESYALTGNQYDVAFTGITKDIASSFYDFLFRNYIAISSRWVSPDPSGIGSVDPTTPQTWNRYAYVANNPLSSIDPLGLNQAGPGECQGGVGLCPWEGGGGNPVVDDGGGGFCDASGQCFGTTFMQQAEFGTVMAGYGFAVQGGGLPIIFGFHTSVNGSFVGDYPGEIYCPPGFACIMWNARQAMWDVAPGAPPMKSDGPSYSHEQVCAASALFNKGGTTFLDALGMIPGEGNVLLGIQLTAGLISAGTTIFQESSPTDAAFAGIGLGLSTAPAEFSTKIFGKSMKVIPVVGNVLSGYATYRDIFGKDGMEAYYEDCMAGKN